MKSLASTKIILETRKALKSGLFPVVIRVIHKRKYKSYTCIYNPDPSLPLQEHLWEQGKGIAMTQEDFDRIYSKHTSNIEKAKRSYLNAIEETAMEVIASLGQRFDFPEFEKRLYSEKSDNRDALSALLLKSKKLREENRIGHANGFDFASRSLKKFVGKDKLPFYLVTADFLKKYEFWMTKPRNEKETEKACSLTTVGMYLRNLRTVYREAIRDGIVDAANYPFGEGQYIIPTGRNIKKALTLKEIDAIFNYDCIAGSTEQRYRDYWIFCYLCNGINIKDLARLKYGNISEDTIVINRIKTERERRKQPRPITLIITDIITEIINRWGNKPGNPDQFIFPIYTPEMTIQQQYEKSLLTIRQINKYIRQVAKGAGITKDVTTYTARHSYASILKNSGASIALISEQLGHSSISTTDHYLSDFEIEEKRKWARTLLPKRTVSKTRKKKK